MRRATRETSVQAAAAVIAPAAKRLDANLQELTDRIGEASIVLIGEASHGTHEFYAVREQLTRCLIADHRFRIVALEADWPDALRAHRYVTGRSDDRSASEALGGFRRFPRWMWRNRVMEDFCDWLEQWNQQQAPGDHAGIFGMDLYSLRESMDSVMEYLRAVDPEAAIRARQRYSCFDPFSSDPQHYGHATSSGAAEPCEDEVVAQLVEMRDRHAHLVAGDGSDAADESFFAEQNARLVVNAERYYRSMFRGGPRSWNLRDEHMADTLAALAEHFDHGRSKMVVWAHNSHLGDARATQMGARGEWNVGQLMRERYGRRVYNIGFSTYTGTVTAARDWGDPPARRQVRPALPGSYEALFHQTGLDRFWLDLQAGGASTELLREPRLQRAIGVIYRPETERGSHYFHAALPAQFDAIVHIDETRALEPLERTSEWVAGELPETYPSGL